MRLVYEGNYFLIILVGVYVFYFFDNVVVRYF